MKDVLTKPVKEELNANIKKYVHDNDLLTWKTLEKSSFPIEIYQVHACNHNLLF